MTEAQRNSADGKSDSGGKFLIPIGLIGSMERPVSDRTTTICKRRRAPFCASIGITKELVGIHL
jgi:hypothetical protein